MRTFVNCRHASHLEMAPHGFDQSALPTRNLTMNFGRRTYLRQDRDEGTYRRIRGQFVANAKDYE